MGIFKGLKGLVGAPNAGDIVEKTGSALDKLFTSKDEKLTHAEVMERIRQEPQKWQAEITKAEATHRTMFVAGARPAILWVCAAGLAFVFVLNPIIQWISGNPGPEMPTEAMLSLVTSLLGLGALRSAEKIAGVAK